MLRLDRLATGQHAEEPADDQGADDRDDQAADVETGTKAAIGDQVVDESANQGTENAQDDIADPSLFAVCAIDQARQPSSQRAKDQPKNQTHTVTPFCVS